MTIMFRNVRIVAQRREPVQTVSKGKKPAKSEVARVLTQLEDMRRDAMAEAGEIESRRRNSVEAAHARGKQEAYAIAALLVSELLS